MLTQEQAACLSQSRYVGPTFYTQTSYLQTAPKRYGEGGMPRIVGVPLTPKVQSRTGR